MSGRGSATLPTEGEEDSVSLRAKVAFLSRADSHLPPVNRVVCKETHMSWVFLAGDRAYKFKKPVRFPYLDFSTLERRKAACFAELRLNKRLAPEVYLDVKPLTLEATSLALDGRGPVVEWLVVMQRLDSRRMLDQALQTGRVDRTDIRRLARVLTGFYRHARPVFPRPAVDLIRWRRALSANRNILLDSQFALPAGEIRQIDQALRDFLQRRAALRAARIRRGHIRDGHGDLRPEHIYLGDGIAIIDCLEFSAELRAVDSLDEVAYLSVECERLGARWVGEELRRCLAPTLGRASEDLYRFYRCYRASLRARLSIAHLLEPQPREPERWPAMAKAYLEIAAKEARALERSLRRRADR
jgi:aminoglycoside phosphotransferase family enzyme